jgi:hypothetical protein
MAGVGAPGVRRHRQWRLVEETQWLATAGEPTAADAAGPYSYAQARRRARTTPLGGGRVHPARPRPRGRPPRCRHAGMPQPVADLQVCHQPTQKGRALLDRQRCAAGGDVGRLIVAERERLHAASIGGGVKADLRRVGRNGVTRAAALRISLPVAVAARCSALATACSGDGW